MTLALVQPPTACAAGGPAFISIEEAARRSGWNVGYLRRRCSDAKRAPGGTWQSRGLARLAPPEGGGKPCWWISEAADSRLVRVKSSAAMTQAFDRSTLTDRQARELDARLMILRRWDEERAAGVKLDLPEVKVTAHFLDRLLLDAGRKVSRATLFNWQAAYRLQGIAGLVDARWRTKGGEGEGEATDAADPFVECFLRFYLSTNQPKATRCHFAAEQKAHEQGWPVRSLKTCQRAIAKLDKAVLVRFRKGRKAFEDECEPAIRRDYSTVASNDIWCGDHHDFDVKVIDPATPPGQPPRFVRPTVTAWQDVRSRKVLGWRVFTHAPNADEILLAFRAAARAHGLPGKIYVDNGKDYRSQKLHGLNKERVTGALNVLAVDTQHCWIYHGQSKPIERNFRTICDQFAREFDTYCGNSPGNRPEDHERALRAGKAPTLAEFVAAFEAYVRDDYHSAPHSGDSMHGRTPDRVYGEQMPAVRTVPEEMLDFALLPRFCPRKKNRDGSHTDGLLVGKHGVTFEGLHFGAFNAEVQKLQGKRVMLAVDTADLSRVLVLDLQGRLICQATQNRKLGWNAAKEDLTAAVKEKKQLRQTLKQYREQRPRMADDMAQLTQRAARRRAEREQAAMAADPLPPAPVRPHRTTLDDQFPAIQRAMQKNAMAAGAELLDLDRLRPSAAALAKHREAGADDELDVFTSLSSAVRSLPNPFTEDES
jgi:hypothetical protein